MEPLLGMCNKCNDAISKRVEHLVEEKKSHDKSGAFYSGDLKVPRAVGGDYD